MIEYIKGNSLHKLDQLIANDFRLVTRRFDHHNGQTVLHFVAKFGSVQALELVLEKLEFGAQFQVEIADSKLR